MNLVELNSVGSLIDLEEEIVYPQLTNGLPDLECGVHIDEVSDEWFDGLSSSDLELLTKSGLK
jgi:hypothetical protein